MLYSSLSLFKEGVKSTGLRRLPSRAAPLTGRSSLLSQLISGSRDAPCVTPVAAARRKHSTGPSSVNVSGLQRELDELAAMYEENSKLYYAGQPKLSDDAFDAIKNKLSQKEDEMERATGKALLNRVSRQVGASVAAMKGLEPPSLAGEESSGTFGPLQQTRHTLPMLSLAARNSRQEVQHWHDVTFTKNLQKLPGLPSSAMLEWMVEPKFDGLAVSATFVDGRLSKLATRGDGEVGQDVTRHTRNIQGLPMSLPGPPKTDKGFFPSAPPPCDFGLEVPPVMEVRGEVYMTNMDFRTFAGRQSMEGKTGTTKDSDTATEMGSVMTEAAAASAIVGSNPRNTAAGALRCQNPAQTQTVRLSFVAYQLLCPPMGTAADANDSSASDSKAAQPLYLLRSQYESLQWLSAMGFAVSNDVTRCNSFEDALDAAEVWMGMREQLDYEVDGCVLKLDDQELAGQLGARQGDPLWALAWKFPPKGTTTRIEGIDLTIGKQGKITPIAILEPVNLGGVVVKQASLGNIPLALEMDLHIGDQVAVIRANDVIPKIEGVVPGQLRGPDSQKWQPPTHCLACSGPLVMEHRDLMCHNPQCIGRGTKQIEVFAKVCLEGSKLAGKSVKMLVDAGIVKSIPDLYTMKQEDLLRLPSWGAKKVQPIMDTIEHSRTHLRLGQLLQGLAINGVGSETAASLAACYHNLRSLQADAEAGDVKSMGEGKNKEKLVAWFASPHNRDLIDRLAEVGLNCVVHTVVDSRAATTEGAEEVQTEGSDSFNRPLADTRMVLTGTFMYGTRNEVAKLLQSRGAQVDTRITNATNTLVIGEVPLKKTGKPTYSASKIEDAKQKDVSIVTELEVMKALDEAPRL